MFVHVWMCYSMTGHTLAAGGGGWGHFPGECANEALLSAVCQSYPLFRLLGCVLHVCQKVHKWDRARKLFFGLMSIKSLAPHWWRPSRFKLHFDWFYYCVFQNTVYKLSVFRPCPSSPSHVIIVMSFSGLSGVWQWGRWPPLSGEEVGHTSFIAIFPVCDFSSEKCGHLSHMSGGNLTWKTRNVGHGDIWMTGLHTTARMCLKQSLWFSSSWPLTCLDPAQIERVGLGSQYKWKLIICATPWWCCVNSLTQYSIFQIPRLNIAAALKSDDTFFEMSKHSTEQSRSS